MCGVLLAGCNSDSDTLSAGEYREQAEAICSRTLDAKDALAARLRDQDRPTAAFYRTVVELDQQQVARLRELKPPDDLAADHRKLVKGNARATELLRRSLLPDLDRGVTPIRAWERRQAAAAPFNREAISAAERLDLEACSLG